MMIRLFSTINVIILSAMLAMTGLAKFVGAEANQLLPVWAQYCLASVELVACMALVKGNAVSRVLGLWFCVLLGVIGIGIAFWGPTADCGCLGGIFELTPRHHALLSVTLAALAGVELCVGAKQCRQAVALHAQ